MPIKKYATGNREAVERMLILKAPLINGRRRLLDDLLDAMGDSIKVEEIIVALKEQCLIEVSTSTLYRWRKANRPEDADTDE